MQLLYCIQLIAISLITRQNVPETSLCNCKQAYVERRIQMMTQDPECHSIFLHFNQFCISQIELERARQLKSQKIVNLFYGNFKLCIVVSDLQRERRRSTIGAGYIGDYVKQTIFLFDCTQLLGFYRLYSDDKQNNIDMEFSFHIIYL